MRCLSISVFLREPLSCLPGGRGGWSEGLPRLSCVSLLRNHHTLKIRSELLKQIITTILSVTNSH